MYRSRIRAKRSQQYAWDVALGIVMLSAGIIILSGYLLFAMSLDCKHAKFADAPYCQLLATFK